VAALRTLTTDGVYDNAVTQAIVGRVGLGRRSGSHPTPPNGTFIRQLASQWDQPVFGLYLQRRRVAQTRWLPGVETLVDEGVLTFG